MNIVLKEGKIPGYTLAANCNDAARMEVVIYFSNGSSFFTMQTLEELGVSDTSTPEMPMKEMAVGSVSVTEPAGFIGEETLLSIVAMATDKKDIPR